MTCRRPLHRVDADGLDAYFLPFAMAARLRAQVDAGGIKA
jgi:hypothetical protein